MKGNLAIIPARGGSKRIPKKNVKNFFGQPIIAYSIQTALNSELFEEVMVSTDSEEIAEIALKYGASVPFLRTEGNSNDYASTVDVIIEVLEAYGNKKIFFDNCCCIYPAAPLTNKSHLQDGYAKLRSDLSDAVFPVVQFGYPIWRGMEITKEGQTKMIWPEYLNSRSQDFRIVYHDAGQWYWFNVERFMKTKSVFSDNVSSIILQENEVQDIDTIIDWEVAEIKFQRLHGKK